MATYIYQIQYPYNGNMDTYTKIIEAKDENEAWGLGEESFWSQWGEGDSITPYATQVSLVEEVPAE